MAELPVVVPGHGRIEGDDPQPVDQVAAVDRGGVGGLIQQADAEIGPVVVVSHRPDHLGAELRRGRFDDGAELGVGVGFALVRQVPGEDQGLRSGTGIFQLGENLA